MYIFAIKTKNARIKIVTINANNQSDAEDEARSVIFNSVNLDDADYDYINSHEWSLVVKRMNDLHKPISNVELIQC